jgi:hypothetical protein
LYLEYDHDGDQSGDEMAVTPDSSPASRFNKVVMKKSSRRFPASSAALVWRGGAAWFCE